MSGSRLRAAGQKPSVRRSTHSPTELVSAIAYVLRNYAHHTGGAQRDRFSSAVVRTVLAVPVGWLLRKGRWRVRTSPRPDD